MTVPARRGRPRTTVVPMRSSSSTRSLAVPSPSSAGGALGHRGRRVARLPPQIDGCSSRRAGDREAQRADRATDRDRSSTSTDGPQPPPSDDEQRGDALLRTHPAVLVDLPGLEGLEPGGIAMDTMDPSPRDGLHRRSSAVAKRPQRAFRAPPPRSDDAEARPSEVRPADRASRGP